MWFFYAAIGSVFSGAVPFLGKIGGTQYGQSASAMVRGTVILICASLSLLMHGGPSDVPLSSLLFFLFAGISDAFAWYFFFRSLCQGPVNETVVVEKNSVSITALASSVFFRTKFSFLSAILIASGIGLVLIPDKEKRNNKIVLYGVLSAIFASAQIILSKFGLASGVSSQVGFWIRSSAAFIVLLLLYLTVPSGSTVPHRATIPAISLLVSGVSAYFGWYFCFRGLSTGSAASVQAVLKLNFWVTATLGWLFSRERPGKSTLVGYGILTAGILIPCFT